MMTLRERLLTTLQGGVSDRIPWNIYASLLPQTPVARAMQRRGLGLTASCRTYRAIYEGVTIREERQETEGVVSATAKTGGKVKKKKPKPFFRFK